MALAQPLGPRRSCDLFFLIECDRRQGVPIPGPDLRGVARFCGSQRPRDTRPTSGSPWLTADPRRNPAATGRTARRSSAHSASPLGCDINCFEVSTRWKAGQPVPTNTYFKLFIGYLLSLQSGTCCFGIFGQRERKQKAKLSPPLNQN